MSLLTTFNPSNAEEQQIPEPDYPELTIKDAATGNNIPITCIYDKDNNYIQTVSIQYAPMEFTLIEQGIGASKTLAYKYTFRLNKFIIRCLFSDSSANTTFRVIKYDVNLVKSYTGVYTVSAVSTLTQDGKYLGEELVVDVCGAYAMALAIESVSAGTVDIYYAIV